MFLGPLDDLLKDDRAAYQGVSRYSIAQKLAKS
jgi:hypothetical protein